MTSTAKNFTELAKKLKHHNSWQIKHEVSRLTEWQPYVRRLVWADRSWPTVEASMDRGGMHSRSSYWLHSL